MVSKSGTTWDVKKTLQKNGMNYQAQLVQDFFHQQ